LKIKKRGEVLAGGFKSISESERVGLGCLIHFSHGGNKTQTTIARRYNKAGLKKQAQHKITTKLGKFNGMGGSALFLFLPGSKGRYSERAVGPPLALHKHPVEIEQR